MIVTLCNATIGLFLAIIGLKHYHLKCEKHMYRWRAFESVWSELLKKDQSSHPNLWKAPNYDVHQIWPSWNPDSNYIQKKQWSRLSLRTIEYATNTNKKYFYTFRINQITFTYGERKKERPNFYGIFGQNLPIFAAFTAILKTKLPQSNAIGVHTPPGVKCLATEMNTLPILNKDFAIENKTRTQQTKYSKTGVFCSSLDLKTAGEKPPSSAFVEIFVWCTRFSFVGLNRARNFYFIFATWVRCITTLGRACWR